MIEERSLVAARPSTTTADTVAVEIRDQWLHKPVSVVEADFKLTRAGVGVAYAITLVVSFLESHALSLTATGVDALGYLTRHGQAAHCRTWFISPSDLSGWLSAGVGRSTVWVHSLA